MTSIQIKPGNHNVGNAGEYYAAHLLSAHGCITTMTLGRAKGYDILALNPKGNALKIQVKTLRGQGVQWRMNPNDAIKTEDEYSFYIFVRLNDLLKEPEYWIFPRVIARYIPKNHQKWLDTPGKHGQKHNDTLGRSFRVKTDKYTPRNWTEFCDKHYKNISILLK